jgi:hypothetical protein
MDLKEIKQLFGVDLTIKNRKPHFVYLRGIYMDQEIENGRKNLNICKELKCNHATGFHYFQRKDFYKNIKEYNEVKIAFDNKDVALFNDIDFRLNNVKYIHYRELERKKPKKIKLEEMPEVRWHYLRIIEALRKDNRHKLWEKPMKEFTIKDYKTLEDLENGK